MPIAWLTIVKSVPWTQVISNAPKLADGAKKLWSAVAKKPATLTPPAAEAAPDVSPEAGTMADLALRAANLEAAADDLRSQMLASSELIKELAEQNAQLINRVEASRVRLLWLASISVAALVIAIVSMALVLAGRGA